jgi:transcriptional regulator with XRE-family HTH domain
MKTFGATLRELRGGRSQDEVARKAGITKETYGRIERGEVSNLRTATLVGIIRALGVWPDQEGLDGRTATVIGMLDAISNEVPQAQEPAA